MGLTPKVQEVMGAMLDLSENPPAGRGHMGRKLSGPVLINGVYYARYSVPIGLRRKAQLQGVQLQRRVVRTLDTDDKTIALQRWNDTYQALKREVLREAEMLEVVRTPLTGDGVTSDLRRLPSDERLKSIRKQIAEYHQRRDYINRKIAEYELRGEEVPEALKDQQEDLDDPSLLLNLLTSFEQVRSDQEPSSLTASVADALYDPDSVVPYTWTELRDLHNKIRQERTGKPMSASWFKVAQVALRNFKDVQPNQLTKKIVKKRLEQLREDGNKKPTSFDTEFSVLRALVNTGIKEDVLPAIKVNPFEQISFSAETRLEDKWRAFTTEELKLVLSGKYGDILTLLCCTSFRISELTSRVADLHLVDGVLKIEPYGDVGVKNKSSLRRVPIPAALLPVVYRYFSKPLNKSEQTSLKTKLRDQIRLLFPDDKQLVVHSTRHTFYTLARDTEMPPHIAEFIAGHAPSSSSMTAHGYGEYPVSVTRKWVERLYQRILDVVG
jgi:hypothetical protein